MLVGRCDVTLTKPGQTEGVWRMLVMTRVTTVSVAGKSNSAQMRHKRSLAGVNSLRPCVYRLTIFLSFGDLLVLAFHLLEVWECQCFLVCLPA